MSSESNERSDDKEPVKYWVTKSMMITNVGSKFKAKEIVAVDLVSRQDPNLVIFVMKVKFGTENDGTVSIYLGSKEPVRPIKMSLQWCTLHDENGATLKTGKCNMPRICERATPLWGFPDFFKSKETKDVTWRVSGHAAYEAPCLTAAPRDYCVVALQEDLLKLLNSPNNADVTFVVKREKIKAHKDILAARCSYFANMFGSGMKESVVNEVKVKDAEPAVFKGMLEFLYSGSPPKNLADIALGLLTLADKYGLDDLKKFCEIHLCSDLKADNFVDALVVAKRHNCPDLLARSKSAFPIHVGVLKESKEQVKQLRDNPDALVELLEHLCLE